MCKYVYNNIFVSWSLNIKSFWWCFQPLTCRSYVFTWHSQCKRLTCRHLSVELEPGNACAPSVSSHLSVQLECSLYKRHPSVSLEWFLFTVHLLFFFVFLSYFFLPESNFLFAVNFGIPEKTLNNGIEMTWFIFYWNPIKLLMSSCSLFHCHFSPLLPVSIGTDPRLKHWGGIFKVPNLFDLRLLFITHSTPFLQPDRDLD